MSSRSQNSHVFYQDLLERHISESSLSPADRFELFDHIENCENCRRILEAEERVTARMKAVPKLVAPSDLRAKILSRAIRDHQERTTTPSEDPALSDLLKNEDTAVTQQSVHTASPNTGASGPLIQSTQLSRPAGLASDIPVFAGRTRPAVSRARRLWRQASPALALTFLGAATVGALYTGQFQSIPFAAEAQQFVWKTVDKAVGREPLPSENTIAGAQPENGWLLYPADSTSQIILSKTQALLNATAQVELDTQPAATPPPLPGTDRMVAMVQSGRGLVHSVNSTVEALARAATSPLPAPAESSVPQIAALVLLPTDSPDEGGGFQNSALADSLENLADEKNGARLTSSDQFTQGGHRFRLVTLELPAGATNRLVQNLNPYESPEDQQIVSVLTSQKALTVRRTQAVRFFASDEARLRSAIQLTANTPEHSPHKERIQFVVVE